MPLSRLRELIVFILDIAVAKEWYSIIAITDCALWHMADGLAECAFAIAFAACG